MAPGANIISLKVLSDAGGGSFAGLEAALQWVVANVNTYNIASINMSLSDGANWNTPVGLYGIDDELAALAALDVIVVSASGNDFFGYGSSEGVGYPSADPNSLSIGAVYDANIGAVGYGSGAVAFSTDADRITPFSQRHRTMTTVMAPGAAISGAGTVGDVLTYHGTSQAAPHIGGIAVLAQQMAVQSLGRRLTMAEFDTLLNTTGVIVNDGDDENDNVTNTGLNFPRVDMLALGSAIVGTTAVVTEYNYDVSGDFVVWQALSGSDTDIFLYDNNTGVTRRLTNNFTEDSAPRIQVSSDASSANVVWVGHDGEFGTGGTDDDSQIFLYTFNTANPGGGTTTQLTHDPLAVGDPRVSETHVTWWGETNTDREIYIYDIASRTSDNISAEVYDHVGLDDYDPQISGSRVVWYGSDGKDEEIYLYDADTDTVTEVTANTEDDGWARIDGSTVVWRGFDGLDFEIFFYDIDSGITTPVTSNNQDDNRPQVSGDNIVWEGYDTAAPAAYQDWDIFRYNVPSGVTTNVSANASLDDGNPQIHGNQVVWESLHLGGNWEVMHVELDSGDIPQNVSDDTASEDRYPVLSESLVVWASNDGQVLQLMVAEQGDPEITETLEVIVNGDAKYEDSETFRVHLDGAEVVDLDVDVPTVVVEPSQQTSVVTILNDDSGMDFGDAPAQYPTLLADDGARHDIPRDASENADPRLYLGALVDSDSDGQPDANALGDDNDGLDDEDGVTWDRLVPGEVTTFQITVTGEDYAGLNEFVGTAYLSAWIDYNRDEIWANAPYTDASGNLISEKIIAEHEIVFISDPADDPADDDDEQKLTFQVQIPANLDAMTTFARFRLTSDASVATAPGGMLATGYASDGEVEDHALRIEVGDASISGKKFNDLNGDGLLGTEPAYTGVAPPIEPVSPGVGVLMSGYDSDWLYYDEVGPNNNLSAGPEDFGFELEFYGEIYDQFYIHNNGAILLTSPSWYEPLQPGVGGFPQNMPMIAPFWADVDTRNSGGSVHMATGISERGNPFIQIDWVDVGYFNHTSATNSDARNSFAVYIEDDPGGDIVAFHYYDHDGNGVVDMSWTTGDADGGAGGFGGYGAEIGFDAGDYANYFSLARPQSQDDLDELSIQYGFRFDPTTGQPVGIEPGVAGVLVYLDRPAAGVVGEFDYDDANGDGVFDPTTELAYETYTFTMEDNSLTLNLDETGNYKFDRLFDGSYTVREVVPEDWIRTAPDDTFYLAGGTMEIQAVGYLYVSDTDAFSIGDGTNTVVFEFDNNGNLVNDGAVGVRFTGGDTATTIARAIANAVNAARNSLGLGVIGSSAGSLVTLSGTLVKFHPGDTALLPIDGSQSNPAGYYEITLRPSEQLQGADFGNYKRPHISVLNAAVVEGNSGVSPTTKVNVTVEITESFGAPIRIDYETESVTALGGDLQTGPANPENADYHEVTGGSITVLPHGTPLAKWDIRTLTSNRSNDYDYRISRDSVVWQGYDGNDWEIYVYDEATDTIQRLTDNGTDDKLPDNDKFEYDGTYVTHVVWAGIPDPYDPTDSDYEIYLYSTRSQSTVRLTDNAYDDKAPVVSDSHVVWWGKTSADSEIFLSTISYDASDNLVAGTPQNISNNNFNDYDPRISGANAVWYGSDGSDLEVYLYRGATGTRTQITNNTLTDQAVQIDGRNVVWQQNTGGLDEEILLYQFDPVTSAGTVYRLTDNAMDDIAPQVSGDNVVWQRAQGSDWEIFYSDVSDAAASLGAVNISNSPLTRDEMPRVAGNRAVWHTWDGADWEVYYYEVGSGQIPLNLSDNVDYDWYPQVSEEVVAWRVFDNEDYEIVVATQGDPTVTVTITLEINGDRDVFYGLTVPELDETFLLKILGATVVGPGWDISDNVDIDQSTIEILNDDGNMDYGDAPARYPTLLADNGARHVEDKGLYLGAAVDTEDDGIPSAAANGDDVADFNDDEDGVEQSSLVSLLLGEDNTVFVTSTDNVTTAGAYLSAWIDFNQDGDWADSGEHLYLKVPGDEGYAVRLATGEDVETLVTFSVPAGAVPGDTYARFRFGSVLAQVGEYTGIALDGEVEDYLCTISGQTTGGSVTRAGNTVTVAGTDSNDVFQFTGDTGGGQYTIALNGEVYVFAAAEVAYVNFSGGAGADTVVFYGTSAAEKANLWPDRAVFSGPGFTVTTAATEFATAWGGGGGDVALMHDDPSGRDVFRATPESAKLSGDGFAVEAKSFRYVHSFATEGNGDSALLYDDPDTRDTLATRPDQARLYSNEFYLSANSFDYVDAHATPGGKDVAWLYDDPDTKDTLVASPDEAELYGDEFHVRAKSFRYVHATATSGGGNDVAFLYDDPVTRDVLVASPDQAKLYSGEFFLRANSFRYVHAHATPGGNDVAVMYDDPVTKDTLIASPDEARLYSDEFDLRAKSFRFVHTYATTGGGDVALLYDDPNTTDTLIASPDQARLFSDEFYLRAKSFRYVHAFATPGGNDLAWLYDDPVTRDVLVASPDQAKLYSDEFYLRAKSFRYVNAYATPGGNDAAVLYDDPVTRDYLMTWPDEAKLYGDEFYLRAKSFRHATAYATPGGNDVALMYDDPSGQDTLEAWPEEAKLYGNDYAYYRTAKSFRYVHVFATPGGDDIAYLHDSKGNDIFESTPDQAKLYSDDFYVRAKSFRRVEADASAGGHDEAYLYDSALDAYPDYLEAQDNWARLSNDLLGYEYLVRDFEEVEARSSNASDDENADPSAVDFILRMSEW